MSVRGVRSVYFFPRFSSAYSRIAPNVAVPMPPSAKLAELQREVAGAQDQRDGRDDQVLVVGEVHLVVDPDLARRPTAIRPNTTMLTPPITGSGMAWITAPNLGEKPSTMAISAGDHEHRGRIDLGRRHHADVLGIGGHAGAAGRAADAWWPRRRR